MTLENRHESGRSDIEIQTSEGLKCVVEAKVDATDAFQQSKKYQAHKTALLSSHRPSSKQKQQKHVTYVHWEDLVELLREDAHSTNAGVRFVSSDLLQYLEEHHMIREKDPVEIYAREINEPMTLTLFLHARMYGCWYESGSKLPKAHYFAPHFGKKIADQHPGVHLGISYIAKIEQMEVIDDWNNFIDTTISVRGKVWYNKHKQTLDGLKKHPGWDWKSGKKRTFLYMGEPRLVFSPSVKKENLQEGKGWLSKRFLSFDELFEAWGC